MKHFDIQKIFPALGTVNSVQIRVSSGSDENRARKDAYTALGKIRDLVTQLDDMLSCYKETSELSCVNKNAGRAAVPVSQETAALFEASVYFAKRMEGAFDVTAGSLSHLWKHCLCAGRIPNRREIHRAKKLTDYRQIEIQNESSASCRVLLKKKGMRADFGGIAKGYAADRARAILQDHKITDAVINFGGTVIVMGRSKRIGIQNPFTSKISSDNSDLIGTLTVRDRAVVTSGSYEQFYRIGEKMYHHIIDPATGAPSKSGLRSVTLIGTDATELDALATGAFIMGPERAMPLLNARRIGAIWVRENGEILRSTDLSFTIGSTIQAADCRKIRRIQYEK